MKKSLKKTIQILLCLSYFFGGLALATDFLPKVTLRSMTGFVFFNALGGATGEDEEAHFILAGVSDSSFQTAEVPGGIVQLREPPGRRAFPACVSVTRTGQVFRSTNCNEGEVTYFTLLPASNGAVQIKSLHAGVCLVGTQGEGVPSLDYCTETGLIVSPDHLWFIGPPFSAAHISPLRE